MHRNTATVSDRLAGILSDLSSFVGQDSRSAALPVCESHDRDSFVKRVRSFQSSFWFAKPHWLSPVTCARYGWTNVDVDLLRCVGCRSVLVVRMPSSFDPAIYDACQKRLTDQLQRDAHHPCCTWPSCPTPDITILAHCDDSSQTAIVEEFINKALLLHSIGKDLPFIEHSMLSVTESDVTFLCSLVRNSPKFLHDAEIPGALQSAVLLALTGWYLSDDVSTFPGCTSVQCSLCMRQPGLWNYISIASGNDVDSHSNGEYLLDDQVIEMNADTVKEFEDSQTAVSCSPRNNTDDHILPSETDCMQSATDDNDISTPADECLLPSVAMNECIDIEESSMLSHDVEPINYTKDSLISSTSTSEVPSSVAVTSKEDDVSEITAMPCVADAGTGEHGNHSSPAAADHASLEGSVSSDSEMAHFPELTASPDDSENVAYDEPQTLSCEREEEETETVDVGVSEEAKVEQRTNDSDESDLNSTSLRKETGLATGSDVQEMVSESADIVMACDKPCESNDDKPGSGNQLTGSDSEEDNICGRNSTEDKSYMAKEQPSNTVTAEMEFVEETTPDESNSGAEQCNEQSENVTSSSQEALQMKTDIATEALTTDLTSTIGDAVQQSDSLTGQECDLEQSVGHTGIVEDVRQLLTELIDGVVQETGCTGKTLKRRAEDAAESTPQPQHKRPFSTVSQRTVFDPVAEHRLWCPYISDAVSDQPSDAARDVEHKPWLRYLRQLVPDPATALTHVQTSPVPEGIERIRKLFRSWTSSA